MSSMRARLVRLEQRLCPEHETQRPGWCCAISDPQPSLLDALPPTCPHGGRWLLMFTDTDAAARTRSRTRHGGTLDRSFTIRIDRACGGVEAVTDAHA
jgi:hypothetical protein